MVDLVWNVMAHAQKPDFVFQRNRLVHLNRPVGGVSSVDYCAAEVWASAVVKLDMPCSTVVWRVLATHSIRQFPLHFPSRASPCAITFQLDSTVCFKIIIKNSECNHYSVLFCIFCVIVTINSIKSLMFVMKTQVTFLKYNLSYQILVRLNSKFKI